MDKKISTRDKILLILQENKGKYISGEEIASQINLSRNAVWKGIKKLKISGYEINSVAAKGYCLTSAKNIISISNIESKLEYKDFYTIEYKDEVSSTNTILKEEAIEGAVEGRVLIANAQTQGRGRLNRNFYSPENTGIYMSILLRPKLDINQALMITTAAAVSVCQGIEKASGKASGIKWVNDIFIEDKKVCGILTEAGINLESKTLDYAILGIGINIANPENEFPSEIKSIAGSIFEASPPENIKNILISEILNSFLNIYKDLPEDSYIEEYIKRSIIIGKNVTLIKDGKNYEVKVLDIDNQCRLKIKNGDKIEYINSGEVSLKL